MSGKKGQRWKRDADHIPNQPKYKKAKDEIAVMLHKGYLINEIYAEILLDIPDMLDVDFQRMVRSAYEEIKLTIHRNREYIFKLHMDRYESTYRKVIEMIGRDQRPLTPKTDWHEMVGRYIVALKALKHKEDLLGLHNKDVVIEINENDAEIKLQGKRTGKAPFSVDRLDDGEVLELLKLLKTANVSEDDGVRRLVIKKSPLQLLTENPEEQTTVDTIYEEMPEKVVDKIQSVVEVVEPNEPNENVFDARDPAIINKPKMSMEQVKQQLKQQQLDRFKEILSKHKKDKPQKR